MRNNKIKWLLLSGISIAVVLTLAGFAELYMRWLLGQYWQELSQQSLTQNNLLIHRKSADPELVYELTPGASVTRDGVIYQINSQGFRDDDFGIPVPKTTDEFRVVVIGDSVAWGWGVRMEKAWPQQLEQSLQTAFPDRRVTVYNLAVNGYSTRQEVRTLETKGLAYEPDMVILNYTLNDPTIEEGGMWPYFAPITRLETWYRARIFWQGIRNAVLARLNYLPSPLPHDNPWDYTTMVHGALFNQVHIGIQELSRLKQDHSLKVILLVTPLFDFQKNEPYPWRSIHNRLRSESQLHGFIFMDAQPYYINYNSRKLSVDLIHPNELGHAIIAEAMTQKIVASELLQQ